MYSQIVNIEKYSGKSNFRLWRIMIRALLKQQDIWVPISSTKPTGMTDVKYKLQEEKAHITILLYLLDEVLYKAGDEEMTKRNTITLEDVRSSLRSRELRQQALGSGYESQSMGLSTTSLDRGQYQFKKGKDKGGASSSSRGPNPRDICNYCKDTSHWKIDCPKFKEKGLVAATAKDDSCYSGSVCFSTLTPLPGLNVGDLPPITVSTFTAITLENTPLANHASTSANPDPAISLAFVKANYEVLKSLLREHPRQMRSKDLYTKVEYYSEEYDEEREMEPRPTRVKETTPALRAESPRAQRQKGRVIKFEEAPNKDRSRVERESEGKRPLKRREVDNENRGVNLPLPLVAHLGRNENGQPLQSTLTSAYRGYQSSKT
ncbi:retrovirus-related pol polyprotein from transposon TNT 1-94 [Tanacetum coccineum]